MSKAETCSLSKMIANLIPKLSTVVLSTTKIKFILKKKPKNQKTKHVLLTSWPVATSMAVNTVPDALKGKTRDI